MLDPKRARRELKDQQRGGRRPEAWTKPRSEFVIRDRLPVFEQQDLPADIFMSESGQGLNVAV